MMQAIQPRVDAQIVLTLLGKVDSWIEHQLVAPQSARFREGNFFIHKLYLEIDKQRKGMGSEVFRQLLALMSNLEAVRLQVNRQNMKAINFYFKMGFVIEQVADFDIGDGYFMNDFVMVYRPK